MYSKGNVKTKTPKEKVASVLNATVDEVYWKLHTTSSTQESLENEGKEVEKGDEWTVYITVAIFWVDEDCNWQWSALSCVFKWRRGRLNKLLFIFQEFLWRSKTLMFFALAVVKISSKGLEVGSLNSQAV